MHPHRFLTVAALAAAATLPLAGLAGAQGVAPQANPIVSPVPAPEAVTLHAKITAINPKTRAVSLVGANGQHVTVTAGPLVRLELLKVGDAVNAQYYRSVAFVVGVPGSPAPENEIDAAMARGATTPGGEAVAVVRISGVIVGIDLPAHSIDLVNPNGGPVRTVLVTDPKRIAMLPQLKVGDTVTAVITRALAVRVTPAAKLTTFPEGGGEGGHDQAD